MQTSVHSSELGAAGERFNYDYITGSAGNAALMAFTKALGGTAVFDLCSAAIIIRAAAPPAGNTC
jgi:hypothetical protein